MSEPQPQNDIVELRASLFDTLRALSDKENPMELERAKAINETAQTIINSVKAEYDAIKVIGGTGSGFIPALPPGKPSTQLKPGLTIHRMPG
jgi:hypothetical protein